MDTVRTSGSLTDAERARSVLASAAGLSVGMVAVRHDVHRHAVDLDGSLLFAAPAGSAESVFALAPGLPAVRATVTAVDLAELPFPDRVRGRVRLIGDLGPATGPVHPAVLAHLQGESADRPVTGVLRLRPTSAWLQWRCERSAVDGADEPWREVPAAAVSAARADPLTARGGRWMAHLDREHRDVLAAMVRAVRPGADVGGFLRPLLVDRYGLVVRTASGDVRLPFPRPVGDLPSVGRAFGELAGSLVPRG